MKLYLIIYLCAGIFIGIVLSCIVFMTARKNPDGTMVVNTSNPDKDVFRLEMHTPFGEIPNKKYLLLNVEIEDV